VGEDPRRVEAVSSLAGLARRLGSGEPLTDADASLIVDSHDLIAIGMMADDVRRRLHGTRTTFCRVFEMHVDAPVSSLPRGLSAGEIRLVGAPSSLDAACAAAAQARGLAGGTPLSGFSLDDLAGFGGKDAYRALRDAGLEHVAFAPADWDAVASATALARDAGLSVERLAVASPPDGGAAGLMARARDLQHALGGFRVFAPLARVTSDSAPTTGYDDVKLISLARLMLPDVPSIQVDWTLYGPKLAQVALTMGADDVDGVAAVEPGLLGTRRSAIEEIRGNIVAAGFDPVERDGAFRPRAA
jgi:aminodeoxyfutalosine synthase